MTFRPTDGTFGYQQEVNYTLNPTVKTESGETAFTEAKTWRFTTAYFTPDADFGTGPNAQVLDVDGGRSLQYRNIGGEAQKVTFNLYRQHIPIYFRVHTTLPRNLSMGRL